MTLQQRLADPAPGFVCIACERTEDPARFVAPLRHRLGGPATEEELNIMSAFELDGDMQEFYCHHNALCLYGAAAHLKSDDAGIKLFAIREWGKRTMDALDDWDGQVGQGFNDKLLPYRRDEFVAIGIPCGAWSYIHLVVRGPCKGMVFWWPWSSPPASAEDRLGGSFISFTELLSHDPVSVLNDIFLCYTRYSDGRTATQWIPEKYVPDVTKLHMDAYGFLL